MSAITKPRRVFWEGESWQDEGGSGPLKGGRQVGCVVKFSCVLELELSFDADELIQPSVEGTTATAHGKSESFFSLLVVTWLRASPLSARQLNSCTR